MLISGYICIWIIYWFILMKTVDAPDGGLFALWAMFWPLTLPVTLLVGFFDWLGDLIS